MNFYILVLVSLPEAFLNIVIILLFAGKKEKLNLNKPNLIRFTMTLVLMLLASSIIRPIAPSVMINMFLHTIVYVIIFVLIYRLKLPYAILSISFMFLIYSTLENLYLPFIITYAFNGIDNFFNQYYLLPLFSIPNRVGQIAVILFLWKYEILLVTRINKRFHKFFIISSLSIIFIEFFLGYLFCSYFNKINLIHQISLSVSLISFVFLFNFLIFKFFYVVISDMLVNGYKKYNEFEENVLFALTEIQTMLKHSKVDEAIKLIDELNGKNDEQ